MKTTGPHIVTRTAAGGPEHFPCHTEWMNSERQWAETREEAHEFTSQEAEQIVAEHNQRLREENGGRLPSIGGAMALAINIPTPEKTHAIKPAKSVSLPESSRWWDRD